MNLNTIFCISPLFLVFRAYVYPVGLLPWSEGSDDILLTTNTQIPGATSAQCWYVQGSVAIPGQEQPYGVSVKCFPFFFIM